MTLNIQVEINEAELMQSVGFIYGDGGEKYAAQIVNDLKKDLQFDFDKIQNRDERFFHANGFVALLFTLKAAQEKSQPKTESKIITLK